MKMQPTKLLLCLAFCMLVSISSFTSSTSPTDPLAVTSTARPGCKKPKLTPGEPKPHSTSFREEEDDDDDVDEFHVRDYKAPRTLVGRVGGPRSRESLLTMYEVFDRMSIQDYLCVAKPATVKSCILDLINGGLSSFDISGCCSAIARGCPSQVACQLSILCDNIANCQ